MCVFGAFPELFAVEVAGADVCVGAGVDAVVCVAGAGAGAGAAAGAEVVAGFGADFVVSFAGAFAAGAVAVLIAPDAVADVSVATVGGTVCVTGCSVTV